MPNISRMLFEKVVKEIAERGNCVIVGRGADWFLRRPRRRVPCLSLCALRRKDAAMLAPGREPRARPINLLESVDRERAAFVRKYYGKVWPDRSLYNLMMNTKSRRRGRDRRGPRCREPAG